MPSLTELAKLQDDDEFKARIVVAFKMIAHEVLAEDSNTTYHELRINHANHVLQWSSETINNFTGSVLSSPAVVQNDTTDENILEGVRQIWNSLIGINGSTVG